MNGDCMNKARRGMNAHKESKKERKKLLNSKQSLRKKNIREMYEGIYEF
jgi:hypothetical protein